MVTGVKGWFGKAAQAAQPLVSIWQSDFGQLGVYLKGLASNAQAFGGSLLDVVTNGGGLQNFLTGLNNIISPLVNWWITLTRNVSIFIGTLSDSGGVQAFLASLSELWKGLTQLGQGLADAVTGFLAVGQNGGVAAPSASLWATPSTPPRRWLNPSAPPCSRSVIGRANTAMRYEPSSLASQVVSQRSRRRASYPQPSPH